MGVAEVVLILGVAALAGQAFAFTLVRLSSPGLKGMGWTATSFACASVGAACMLLQRYPGAKLVGADLAVLSALILLHVAVLRVVRAAAIPVWQIGLVIGLPMVIDLLHVAGFLSAPVRTACLGLVLAFQGVRTARVLSTVGRRRVGVPASFSAAILIGFAVFNVLRTLVLVVSRHDQDLQHRLSLLAFALFLGTALSLGFGFFWISTAALTAEAEHMASTDPLTRLYNRRVFLKWCEKELSRSQQSGVPFSLLMVDLDHFKRINDSFGHHRGDEVLCAAVERMQDSVRGIDVLCRWGGEEFAVLLPNAPADATRIVAERIRENIQKMTLSGAWSLDDLAAAGFRVTVSIGAATYRDDEDDIPGMLLRADRALYRAKTSGRNQVLVAT